MGSKYDFSGWATKNDVKCSDGRTIRKNAFIENDGKIVPLVWQHQHNSPDNVLGHALLENRNEGVYAYCSFNDTEMGQNAKELVMHGDITSLSIFANKLKHNGADVIHGMIREVSLVLAGANPDAVIDSFSLAHADDGEPIEILACSQEPISLCHSDEEVEESEDDELTDEELDLINEMLEEEFDDEDTESEDDEELEHADGDLTIGDVINNMSKEKKDVLTFIVAQALESKSMKHSIEYEEDYDEIELEHADGRTVGDVLATFTDDEHMVLEYMVAKALEENISHSDDEGDIEMKYNVFENEMEDQEVLSHSELCAMIDEAREGETSLKKTFLAHAGDYGIDDIEYLFPDYKTMQAQPDFIKRDTGWVSTVMNGVHHTPFSRIKSVHADLREDEARAKGYMKGNLKFEEVFGLLKRTTDPQTVYKKQKLDRDDIIDITDFSVVAWLKGEMRGMLDEELARAILIGDGRSSSSPDKISAEHIRPIWGDNQLYAINKVVEYASTDTDDEKGNKFIKTVVKSRKDYKGSGNPVMFTTEDQLTNLLLMEDGIKHRLYKNEQELATALRVSKIITVPVMDNQTRTADGITYTLAAVIVNLNDYNVGADKGGAVSMFEDFDIDYNQEKYLIETRCSGALVKPFSAITIETKTAESVG